MADCPSAHRGSIPLRTASYIPVAPIGLERDATNVKVGSSNLSRDANTRLAQLVAASLLQSEGRKFEPFTEYQFMRARDVITNALIPRLVKRR